MKKKLLTGILTGLCLVLGSVSPAMADSRRVVTLGVDLSEEQKNTMMRYFGVSYDAVDLIYINNTDEREHLGAYVPMEQIGSHTYSCALVAPTTSGGIQVKTANLDWVTCNMIASTLSTSGVTNCQVVAASPFKVSGTGALTGVIMAYETASKETLDPVKKDLANQELVITGNLANEVGQSKATAIINETKIEVVEKNVTNVEEITNIVNNVSNNYGVNTSPDQSMVIAELMQKIAEQEYDITQLKATLDRVQANVAGDAGATEEEQIAAEEKAQASQKAADEAAKAETAQTESTQTESAQAEEIQTEAPQTEETESILEHTDPSALESDGMTVVEGDTLSSVQEQSEAQKESEGDFGIPEASEDGTMTEVPFENPAETEVSMEETESRNTENQQTEIPMQETENTGIVMETEQTGETEAASETDLMGETENPGETEMVQTEMQMTELTETETAATEAEVKPEELDPEDKVLYEEVKADMENVFATPELMNEDGSYVMYLTEEASKKVPEELEKYLLSVLFKGADAVAEEEKADPEIPQNIMEETSVNAPDKNYENAELKQVDKFVRRFVFKDSEKILEDSMLEETDKVFLYNEIMKVLEKAYKVEPDQEEIMEEAPTEAMPAEEQPTEEMQADPAAMEEIPMEEIPMDGAADEFAGFEEETGSF